MEEREALEKLCRNQEKLLIDKNKQLEEYEAIGTVEECRKAVKGYRIWDKIAVVLGFGLLVFWLIVCSKIVWYGLP